MDPEQRIKVCLKTVEIHFPAGQEFLQVVDSALPEVLGDRGSLSAGSPSPLMPADYRRMLVRHQGRAAPGPVAYLQFAISANAIPLHDAETRTSI